MTNPFAPAVPAQPTPPAGGNPFAVQPAAPAPAAPAQNPYAQPAAAPVQQPQYAAPAPVTQPAAAPPALDPSRLAAAPPPIVGEGTGAKLADMFGRLVLVFPLALASVPRNPQFITAEQRAAGNVMQDRLTATVVVLDAGAGRMDPIQFGGAPYALPPKPHTDSAPLPYVRKGMWINQSRLISQLTAHLPAQPGAAPGMVAGRVHKAGPNQNDPWYLIAATEQELALVGQYLQLVASGQFPHPLA